MGKKGKAHGRAGQKKKAGKASQTTPPWMSSFGRGPKLGWEDSDEEPSKQFRGFAQSSPRSFSQRDPAVKLRHQSIRFVSAGTNTPQEPDVEEGEDGDSTGEMMEEDVVAVVPVPNQELVAALLSNGDDDTALSRIAEVQMSIHNPGYRPSADTAPSSSLADNDSAPPLFIVDTTGDPTILASQTLPSINRKPIGRTPSPTPSSSSEEVVFQGRNKSTVRDDPLTISHAGSVRSSDKVGSSSHSRSRPTADRKPFDKPTNVAPEMEVLMRDDDDAANDIATLTAEWRGRLREKQAGKGKGSEKDTISLAVPDPSRSRKGKKSRKKDNRILRNPNGADVDDNGIDEATEAAYDDYMANLIAQLDADDQELPSLFTRSELIGGASMMIDGIEMGDDEVLDDIQVEGEESTADSSGELEDLDEDEDDAALSDLDSSDLEAELEYAEREQWEDEEDIRERRIAAMQDEQLARLFAKQEELGLGGDALIIDDGLYISDDDMLEGIGDIDEARAGLDALASSSFGKSAKRNTPKGRSKVSSAFPSASMLADTIDQYGEAGFDIMDMERPSLRATKRGRKGQLPPEIDALSDDSLKYELAGQWDNDRARKSVRKAEREELRRQGLLGSAGRKGKADLSQKYLEGMTFKQVMDEIRVFMQNEGMQSRPFPPMEKRERKKLHEVASAFNLKSKSVGAGKNRFPVLYKTRVTLEYDEAHFERIMVASSRGFLKVTARGNKPAKKGRAGAGGGFDKAAVSLRDGEIVGAHAAEISQNSFGHKLMERMGWSRGTALGKDGEGMLLPVAQVMRSGKAGLG